MYMRRAPSHQIKESQARPIFSNAGQARGKGRPPTASEPVQLSAGDLTVPTKSEPPQAGTG